MRLVKIVPMSGSYPHVMEAPRGYFSAFGGQEIPDVTKELGERGNFVDYMAIKLIPGAHPFHVFAEAATAAVLEPRLR